MKKYICEKCGKEFESICYTQTPKYCSQKCNQAQYYIRKGKATRAKKKLEKKAE